MAMTVRLPEALREEAKGYGERVGLTLNALIGVALREYLDQRQPERVESGRPAAVEAPVRGAPVDLARAIAAKVSAPAVDVVTEHFREARVARVKTKPKRGRK